MRIGFHQGIILRRTQTTGQVKSVLGLNTNISGRHVVILEDIIDSGNTMAYLLKDLEKKNPASLHLSTLLFKPAALKHPLKIDYIGFEIPEALW
ncbi:MAG: phosphoribosyltransferase family protein [Saprospiraceae bacterium]